MKVGSAIWGFFGPSGFLVGNGILSGEGPPFADLSMDCQQRANVCLDLVSRPTTTLAKALSRKEEIENRRLRYSKMSSIFLPLIFLPIRLLIPAVGSEGSKMVGRKLKSTSKRQLAWNAGLARESVSRRLPSVDSKAAGNTGTAAAAQSLAEAHENGCKVVSKNSRHAGAARRHRHVDRCDIWTTATIAQALEA